MKETERHELIYKSVFFPLLCDHLVNFMLVVKGKF